MRSEPLDLKSIRASLEQKEAQTLSAYATPNALAIRRQAEEFLSAGYRQAFSVDVDRILHSAPMPLYRQDPGILFDPHDHITHRVLHVQLVSKIAGRSAAF